MVVIKNLLFILLLFIVIKLPFRSSLQQSAGRMVCGGCQPCYADPLHPSPSLDGTQLTGRRTGV